MNHITITPTPGRVVWFHPSTKTGSIGFACPPEGVPLAAIVARVWSDTCVNLTVFDANGVAHGRTSVLLVQEGAPRPTGGEFCEWMPYQLGQAKKAEAAGPSAKLGALIEREKNDIEREIQAKGLTAPRVTPADIEAVIASEHYFTAREGVLGMLASDGVPATAYEQANVAPQALGLLTFCVLVLHNGFTVTGESACASPENFDAEVGRKVARANAVAKVWPLLGYALKDRLAAA